MNKYFTITTLNHSGLGDQLGTQFTRLYAMGLAEGREYIYTPIYFSRSIKPHWYERNSNICLRWRSICFFLFGQSFLSSVVNVLLTHWEKHMEAKLFSQKDNFAEFLGLKNLQKTNHILQADDDVIHLSWSGDMWEKIPDIDANLRKKGIDVSEIWQTIFSEAFNMLHPDSLDKSVVMHMRLGDSTTIELADTKLIVYDKYLYTSEEQMQAIFAIDHHRSSILPEQYLPVYNQLIDAGYEQITILSDGYDLTYKNILRNLMKRKCPVHLSRANRKQLMTKLRHRNDVFQQFDGAKLVIGETEEKLEQSVIALAHADCVVWGCGGFAVNMHNMFKPLGKQTYIVNIKEFNVDKIR